MTDSMNRIYEIFGTDPHAMTMALMDAADVASRIPEDASVALKPNLVLASHPDNGAVTHAEVVSGCLEYLQAHGIQNISVMESAWVGDRTLRALQTAGYEPVLQRYGVPFYDLKKDEAVEVDTPFGKMEVCRRALETDYLIDLPVLKGHCQTVMTCAIKNLKGCIPDREKRRFHSNGLTKPIAALGAVLKPSLVIVDSICGDLNFEEGGNPVHTNRMFLGDDAVAVDAYGCRLMGLSTEEVAYLPLAEQWGAGRMDLDSMEIVTLNEAELTETYPKPVGLVKRLTGNVIQDKACSACFASLVRALYVLDREGYSIEEAIAIGQGWQNRQCPGIGIGRCTKGAKKSIGGCPPAAKDIIAFLKQISSE